jgi:hypothetical protein
MSRQYRENEEPHREIVKILPVSVRRFPNADATRAPEHPVDIGHHPLRLFEEERLALFLIERNQEHDAKRIGPRIALPVGPYALRAHPAQLFENVMNVSTSRHGEAHTPKG